MKRNHTITIDSKGSSWIERFKEILHYKDLIGLLVKRDVVTIYKQTILGPIWIVIQPLLTTFTFTIVFSQIAGIETGTPPVLFYLSGIVLWTFFSENLLRTSETFYQNQNLFSKVYFPRLIVPISSCITNAFKLVIQSVLLVAVLVYYFINSQGQIGLSSDLWLLPLVLIFTALFGLSIGLIISSITIKYRDVKFLVSFGVQLLMYFSPIVYPLDIVSEKMRGILALNPLTVYLEYFKGALLGVRSSSVDMGSFMVAVSITILFLIVGLYSFNRAERTFIDTI